MMDALLLFRIMGIRAAGRIRRSLLALSLLLPLACTTSDNPLDSRVCGTSCGGGNPPSVGFAEPFTGTVSLFAASQNPVMDSLPFFTIDLAAADSLRLERSTLDSILESDKLDSVLRHTLSDSARKARPATLLEFNLVVRSGDSAWLIPGIGYQKGGKDTQEVFQVGGLAPIATFKGKVVLPPAELSVKDPPPQNYLYFAGTPYHARIGFDSAFVLQGYASRRQPRPEVFRYTPRKGSSADSMAVITLMKSKQSISTDSSQVLHFDTVVDSIGTTWKPPF